MAATLPRPDSRPLPRIIQGGMGVGVSSWRLARRVAELGEFGVVSGTGIDTVVARELQQGDPNGRLRVLADYPDRETVDWLTATFYVEGGIAEGTPYRLLPIHRFNPTNRSQRVLSAATFSEVALAKEGHDGLVGINLLAKLKRYTLPCLYGAMLAGVDGVMMGAGIPAEEAEELQKLAAGQPARLRLEVDAALAPDAKGPFYYALDPADLVPEPQPLACPAFYPVISSDLLAAILLKKLPAGSVAGWIVEGPTAGGHNAPPRNKGADAEGNPVYDARDAADLSRIAALGLPFWLAGGYGTPERVAEALAAGAAGVQVGSLFSLADESGYPAAEKEALIGGLHRGDLSVRTDGRVSGTGFPFKVVEMEGTLGLRENLAGRTRICDLGYLQQAYVDAKGRVQGRCPAEPVADYLRKGGKEEDTERRACLCNGLMANIGLAQTQKWGREERLFTAGDDLVNLPLGSAARPRYSAEEVVRYLRPEPALA
jgi:NAD(P)H-dependent flavin oxidoreductase YrpB (nitropropane dioxygenase family)